MYSTLVHFSSVLAENVHIECMFRKEYFIGGRSLRSTFVQFVVAAAIFAIVWRVALGFLVSCFVLAWFVYYYFN